MQRLHKFTPVGYIIDYFAVGFVVGQLVPIVARQI